MSETNWRGLGAGRELDCEIAKNVFLWREITEWPLSRDRRAQRTGFPPDGRCADYVPMFSTDHTDAAIVLAWVRQKCLELNLYPHMRRWLLEEMRANDASGDPWVWFFMDADQPLTICRVALTLTEETGK